MLKRMIIILNVTFLATVSGLSLEQSGIDWPGAVITAAGNDRITVDERGVPVDPDTGRNISISEARNMSYARAREKAVNAAALIITGVRINNEFTIGDIIERDPLVRARMTRVIHEYSRFRDRPSAYMETSCELKIKTGYLITALHYDFPMEDFPQSDLKASPTLYTSIIVDVRGLEIRPMLLPSIHNENGLEIYGKNFISGDDAVRHLAVSYAYTEKDAKQNRKAGRHPFFCAAVKNLNGSPVLSDDDIKRIFSHKKNSDFVRKCRVIFIIDR